MKIFLTVLTACFLCFSVITTASAADSPEVTQSVRNDDATKKLKAKKDIVTIYVKGLCCPSCAIGVRKKVKALKFVNTKRLNKGVDLDAKTQIVTIALKKGKKVDIKALKKAILDAGYKPVHLYTLNKGKLVTQPFTKSK